MNDARDITAVGALLGDPGRSKMLQALLDGRSRPAGELAHVAGVSPQTASLHLAKLIRGGLLTVAATGRHRYYRLAGRDVARALEAVRLIAPAKKVRARPKESARDVLRRARTCYDHLAGELGVAVTDALIDKRVVAVRGDDIVVTRSGDAWLRDFGVVMDEAMTARRRFARTCLDWTERRIHIAGALGSAIARRFFDLGWIVRRPHSRALTLTDKGRVGARAVFDI